MTGALFSTLLRSRAIFAEHVSANADNMFELLLGIFHMLIFHIILYGAKLLFSANCTMECMKD